MPVITSRSNETIKAVARLVAKRSDEVMVLEGPHLLGEALSTGLEIELVLATTHSLARDHDLQGLLAGLESPLVEVADGLLDHLADADSPRGVLAVVRRATVAPPTSPNRGVFLDGVQEPGNVGAIARVLEATGGDLLLLGPGCAHPHHPRALRASAGSLLRLPWVRCADLDAARHYGSQAQWWGLDAHAREPLWDLDLPGDQAVILALGSEGAGLSPLVQAHCHRRVAIPLHPPVESLNVATAAAVVLFELARRAR